MPIQRKRKSPANPADAPAAGAPESILNLTDLKTRSMSDLMELAEQYQVETASSLRKQELIFAILQACASQNGAIHSDGVLEILPDGYGFLRSPLSSYMPGPDDVYVSPSQIRRYHLRKGDCVSGQVRPPREGERYFALVESTKSALKSRNWLAIWYFLTTLPLFIPISRCAWRRTPKIWRRAS